MKSEGRSVCSIGERTETRREGKEHFKPPCAAGWRVFFTAWGLASNACRCGAASRARCGMRRRRRGPAQKPRMALAETPMICWSVSPAALMSRRRRNLGSRHPGERCMPSRGSRNVRYSRRKCLATSGGERELRDQSRARSRGIVAPTFLFLHRVAHPRASVWSHCMEDRDKVKIRVWFSRGNCGDTSR